MDRRSDPTIAETIAVERSVSRISSSSIAEEGRFVSGTLLGGRYRIIGLLGRGGMGEVYRATDLALGQSVALKFLPEEAAQNQRLLERFHGEVRVARQVSHPNVCRVYDIGEAEGMPFISMEYVDGEDLASLLLRIGRLPADKAIETARKLCAGLAAAHDRGIIHRDLKPQNIMMNKRGDVVIMDFGLAAIADQLSGAEVRNGTPAYMAPEQVAGKPVDYRTDIYSLGLIMYEVFTGAQAFQADNAVAVALKQMREAPVPPHEIEPAVPVGVERAILKCLEKEPPKRFQSIGELESAMRASGGAAATQAAVAVAPNYLNRTPLHSQVLYPPAAEPKGTSPVTWVLLGALLVVGAFAGWHWMQVVQSAENLPPPAALPAPAPPDFALDFAATKPAAPQPAAAEPASPEPAPAEAADAKADADKPAEANPETPAPVKHAPAEAVTARETAPAKNQTSDSNATPRNAQRSADKAFGENEPVAAPPVNDHTPSYLWIGRFEHEDKAQGTAKKIEDLGLPVVVVPRHGLTGEFYVVLTGPYGPERIESAMDWLKTQGFADVRLVKNPLGNPRQTPN